MGKRYIVAILIVIFAYAAIILWYQEGSEIFQKFFSRQGQVVTLDQQSYQDYEEYSYVENAQGDVFTTPEEVFATGNIENKKEVLDFAEELGRLAVNEITKHSKATRRPISGNTIASLFGQENQEEVNDYFLLDTIANNEKSSLFIDTIERFFEWLSGTQS